MSALPRALINSGYFHTDMDEDEANQHLAGRNQGTFLVRSHVSLPSALSVSWVTEHCYVQHSLVHMASNRDVFLRNTEYATRFPRLEALIQGLQFLECGCCANHNPESGCPAHSYFPKSAQQGPSVEEEELNKQINDEVLLVRDYATLHDADAVLLLLTASVLINCVALLAPPLHILFPANYYKHSLVGRMTARETTAT